MPTPQLNALIDAYLTKRGVAFKRTEDGRYLITHERHGQVILALDNLARQYTRTQDASSVEHFMDAALTGAQPLPDWHTARHNIFPMLESASVEIDTYTLAQPLSDKVRLMPVYIDDDAGTVRFLTDSDIERWDITPNTLWSAASDALALKMQATEVSYLDAGDLTLGVIEAHEPYKASLIRAPSLKQRVNAQLGWPIFAVAPSRGFVFLLSKADADELGRLGATVVDEFNTAEYPLSTEVWEIDDSGIHAIGAFPT